MRDSQSTGSIKTFSGVKFFPLDPRPEEIFIEDIAHALSMICRFTGHVKKYYSVSEHSIRVSRICKPEDKLHALLHDASEAYISDVSRPVKYAEEMAPYRAIEKNLQRCIYKRFGLSEEEPEGVKMADNRMLEIESRDLMCFAKTAFERQILTTLTPEKAEEEFLRNFDLLFNK